MISYCKVKLYNKIYYYIDESNTFLSGDLVIVPFGKENKLEKGVIESVELYEEKDVPYPMYKTKRILVAESKELVNKEYIVYSVILIKNNYKHFYYLAKEDYQIGNYVSIPFGNSIETGKIDALILLKENDLPVPINQMKYIIGKANPILEKKYYAYCSVRFLHHKKKTFYYIDQKNQYSVGDYVEVPYGNFGDFELGVIVSKDLFLGENAPYPVYRTKFISHLVSEEESNYVKYHKRHFVLNERKSYTPTIPKRKTLQTKDEVNGLLEELSDFSCLSLERKIEIIGAYYYNDKNDEERNKMVLKHPKALLDEIEAFEDAYYIELPKDYKEFLMTVGNGLFDIHELDLWTYHKHYHDLKERFEVENDSYYQEECKPSKKCAHCEHNDMCYIDCSEGGYLEIQNDIVLILTGKYKGSVWHISGDIDDLIYYCADCFSEYLTLYLDKRLTRIKTACEMIVSTPLKSIVDSKSLFYSSDQTIRFVYGLIGVYFLTNEQMNIKELDRYLRKYRR